MYYRMAYGGLGVAMLLALMVLDAYIAFSTPDVGASRVLGRGSLIPVAFAAVMAVAVFEIVSLLRRAGLNPHLPWAVLMCVVLMLSPWLCAGGVLGDSPVDVEALHWQVIWIMVAVLGAVVLHLFRGANGTSIADIASTWLIVLYLGLLPSFAVQLRCDYDLPDPVEGVWNVLIVLTIAFASDVGALYTGMAIGRHKLAASVSPGKSIEGFFGGIAASVVVALGLWWLAAMDGVSEAEPLTRSDRWKELLDQSTVLLERMTMAQVVIFAVVMSLSVQIGDLFESLLKRDAQVKNSSGLIPGMGGVLDVVDGVVFAMPVAWFFLTRVWELV